MMLTFALAGCAHPVAEPPAEPPRRDIPSETVLVDGTVPEPMPRAGDDARVVSRRDLAALRVCNARLVQSRQRVGDVRRALMGRGR